MKESELAQAAAERKLLSDTIDAVMQNAQTVESAEQAQAIAEIKERFESMIVTYENEVQGVDAIEIYYDIGTLLQIVDSKAQKIKSMEASYRKLAGAWFDEKEALGMQIAAQVKEIYILREVAKYDKYANLARIMKRRQDVSVFTHKKAEWLQRLHEFDEVRCAKK